MNLSEEHVIHGTQIIFEGLLFIKVILDIFNIHVMYVKNMSLIQKYGSLANLKYQLTGHNGLMINYPWVTCVYGDVWTYLQTINTVLDQNTDSKPIFQILQDTLGIKVIHDQILDSEDALHHLKQYIRNLYAEYDLPAIQKELEESGTVCEMLLFCKHRKWNLWETVELFAKTIFPKLEIEFQEGDPKLGTCYGPRPPLPSLGWNQRQIHQDNLTGIKIFLLIHHGFINSEDLSEFPLQSNAPKQLSQELYSTL